MKKFILAGILLLTICVGLRWYSVPFFITHSHHCSQDDFISPDYFHSIDTVVNTLLHDNVSGKSIIAQLQKQFPELKKITISYRPTGAHVSFSAHEPICCINNSSILTPEGELFPQKNFSESAISAIPHMHVAEQWMTHAPSFLLSLLQELPSDFNSHYNLEVTNEHCIRLVDKNKPQFTIVFAAEQKNIPALLHQCDLVKNNLDNGKKFDKNAQWAADTRFADYIIAYKT